MAALQAYNLVEVSLLLSIADVMVVSYLFQIFGGLMAIWEVYTLNI